MLNTKKQEYLTVRRAFMPEPLKLIIIADSPPKSGLYFYNPTGRVSEPLFDAMMKHLGCVPKTKGEGLSEFQKRGWLLVDATYEPVDETSKKGRDEAILRDYPLLCADLEGLAPDKKTPIVLVKANVCRLLERRLTEDGFTVLNAGVEVYFPANGNQGQFHEKFGAIIRPLG